MWLHDLQTTSAFKYRNTRLPYLRYLVQFSTLTKQLDSENSSYVGVPMHNLVQIDEFSEIRQIFGRRSAIVETHTKKRYVVLSPETNWNHEDRNSKESWNVNSQFSRSKLRWRSREIRDHSRLKLHHNCCWLQSADLQTKSMTVPFFAAR